MSNSDEMKKVFELRCKFLDAYFQLTETFQKRIRDLEQENLEIREANAVLTDELYRATHDR